MFILNLAWLIPLLPFLAFIAISAFTYRDRVLSHRLAIGGVAIAFVLSQIVFWAAVTLPVGAGEHAFESPLVPWLATGIEQFTLGVYVDPATTVMLFMVTLVCLLIFIYSVGYMHGAPRYSRFFAYISLFATGMLGMVVFNNMLTFFIFWEIMGTCSYLLIGFWHKKETATQAALKAFLVTRVGDLLFMLALVLIYAEVGSLAYRDILNPETLARLADSRFLRTQLSTATVIALLLFGGTVGKSAQFPLHVWLPDAVESPIPASALIHAATTVSAGVFLLIRTFPIFAAAEVGVQMTIMAAIGAFTAIFSSIIAVAQNDIKRVLAFSTMSQLGYMVAALGIGAYVAGAFQLITHAFFKALLFLCSGSVIRGMEHGHGNLRIADCELRTHVEVHPPCGHNERHEQAPRTVGEQVTANPHNEEFNPNDMVNMGGLARRMPCTFWTFLVGGLALSGFPLVTAGFWTTSEILTQAYERSPVVFWMLAVTTGLTAFYTMRQICMTFLGQPRTKAAQHAPESVPPMTAPLIVLAVFAVGLGWTGIPEDFPIIGDLIPDWFHRFVGPTVETAIETGHTAAHAAGAAGHLAEATSGFVWQPLALGTIFALGGLALGWLVYGWKPMRAGEMDRVEVAMRKVWLGWLYACLHNRFYLDRVYQATIVRGFILLADLSYALDRGALDRVVDLAGSAGRSLSHISGWSDAHVVDALINLAGRAVKRISKITDVFDLRVVDRLVDLTGLGTRALSNLSAATDIKMVDGVVEGIGATVRASGRFFRPIQTGRIQDYLLRASLMVLTLVAVFFVILFLHI